MRESIRRIAALIGPIWAIGISAYIFFAPMIRTSSASKSLDHGGAKVQNASTDSNSSWFETFGPAALNIFLFPIIASMVPLLGRSAKSRRILGAASILSLAIFCVLAIFSIGAFYLPSAIALFAALVLDSREKEAVAKPKEAHS